MADNFDFQLVIIGAGVIGLACAVKGSQANKSTLVIERHKSFGYETNSRNSEVIHAGIYYRKNSYKAKLCVKGNKSLYSWCESHNVPYRKIGKFIIATHAGEEYFLLRIFDQAMKNGVKDLSVVSKDELQKIEPNVKGIFAIYSPSSGIVDSHQLMDSFMQVAKQNGCNFAWRHSLVGIETLSNGYKLIIDDPSGNRLSITARNVINAGGPNSDTIAELLGIDIKKHGYRLQYNRSSYFRIASNKANLVNHLIYPITPSDLNDLGIHLTLDLNGGIKIGPDSELLQGRAPNYKVRKPLKEKFYEAASRYVTGFGLDDIHLDVTEIRPSLKRRGSKFKDFIISEESEKGFNNWINLIGIDSPGLTCCLEIAELCMEELDLK